MLTFPHRRNTAGRRRVARAVALALPLLLASTAQAQLDGLPRRQPEGGVKFALRIEVPHSHLGIGDGRRELCEGKLGFHKPGVDGDPKTKEPDLDYQVATDLLLRDDTGRVIDPPTMTFRLDRSGAPIGGAEDLSGAEIPRDLRYRLVASSDFALVPLRMLFRHEMPSGSGGHALKDATGDGFAVRFAERFAGVETVSITSTMRYEATVIRTFQPSGFELIDHLLTFEDERDQTVLAAFCIRMLVHPTRTARDGSRPPAGVFHLSLIKAYQLDWLKETPVLPPALWAPHLERWFGRLADQLFDRIGKEAIGDPSGSPSAVAMRALRILDTRSFARLSGSASTTALAAIAPQLVDLPIAFNPAPLLTAGEKAVDPTARLLLAAGAAAAGSRTPELLRLCRIGVHSRDPATAQAAFLLARRLADPALNAAVGDALRSDLADDTLIAGLLALGAAGGDGALTAISRILANPASDRVKSAAFRALADTGDPAALPLFDDQNARCGSICPDTGRFEVWITRPDKATLALTDIHTLATAARAGDVDGVLTWLDDNLVGQDTNDAGRIALLDAGEEWLTRLGALVPALADRLEDHPHSKLARRVVRASGRERLPDILRDLSAAKDKDDMLLIARLAGCTGDPRAREQLLRMQESEDLAEFEAGSEGIDLMEDQQQ